MNRLCATAEWIADHDPLHVVALPDPVVDNLGYDPRSDYAERYWLGVVGPSSLWVARALVRGLDDSPDGFDAPLAPLSTQLGLGVGTGRQSGIARTLARLVIFGLASVRGDEYAIRRFFPPLARRQVNRLAPHLAEMHRAEMAMNLDSAHWRAESELADVVPFRR